MSTRAGSLAVPALAVLAVVAAAGILHEGAGRTFHYDEWSWVVHRRGGGIDSLLEPHNEHFSLLPVLLYKSLFHLAGYDDYWAYRVVVLLVHLTCVALVFVLARRRVEPAPAALLAALVLCCGAAWEDLLWPFQIGFLGSIAFGLAALALIEADAARERVRDVLAAVAVLLALCCSSLGVPLAAGVAAELGWMRAWRRLWIVAAPVAVYGVWYIAYGGSEITASGLLAAPRWALDAAANAAGATLGQTLEGLGRPLLVLAAIALTWRYPRGPVPARLVALLVVAGVFWLLTGAARYEQNEPQASRYVYLGVVVIVLLVAEALRGVAVEGRRLAVAGAVVAFAVLSQVALFQAGGGGLRVASDAVAAELAVVELLADRVALDYEPDHGRAPDLLAGEYLHQVRANGSSPADTLPELLRAPPEARGEADRVLREIHGLALAPAPRGAACAGSDVARIGPGSVLVAAPAGAPAEVRARRFAEAWSERPLGVVPAGEARLLELPPDGATDVPWAVEVRGGCARPA